MYTQLVIIFVLYIVQAQYQLAVFKFLAAHRVGAMDAL